MSALRSIVKIVKARGFQMGNIWVKQALPEGGINYIDPFILLHHGGPYDIKPGSNHRKMGVGPHPHRGFEPVSFIFQGSLQHRDSEGNDDILDEGDIQWMTSGKGIIHSERPPKKVAESGGVQEFIQLWVNLPKDHKLTNPGYQNLRKKDFAFMKPDSGDGELFLVAGKVEGHTGPTTTFTPINAIKATLKEGARMKIQIPMDHNALVYVVRGKLMLSGKEIGSEQLALYDLNGDTVEFEALEDSFFLFLSGRPLKESIATYGPFVMNNNSEIMAAIRDYQNGEMGKLVEKFE